MTALASCACGGIVDFNACRTAPMHWYFSRNARIYKLLDRSSHRIAAQFYP